MISISKKSGWVDRMSIETKIILRNSAIALLLWIVTLFMAAARFPYIELLCLFGIMFPSALVFHTVSFYKLIPDVIYRKRAFGHYFLESLVVLFISFFFIGFIAMIFIGHPEGAFSFAALNGVVQLAFTMPVTWYWYKRQMVGEEKIARLETKLGQSTASIDFLRSQINPHFLFNALNTIYGTALQEQATRTSEGIEKLGDMMRFMLRENVQEKIALAREIDYLENYISLQRLRTDINPSIQIDTHIEKEVGVVEIAPMLLIPFVENAFKHGISFREPSHIRVSLQLKDNVLYFDVNNSRHVRTEQDPEKDNNGIGLTNVEQRLQLLYKNKHDLIIRESSKEFFVHLTIDLM